MVLLSLAMSRSQASSFLGHLSPRQTRKAVDIPDVAVIPGSRNQKAVSTKHYENHCPEIHFLNIVAQQTVELKERGNSPCWFFITVSKPSF